MFSSQTLDFLMENKLWDSREWFLENRHVYEEFVLGPLAELTSLLEPTINKIDPLLICEPKINKSISRIYRDTRYSKDKSIFREVMWLLFIRDKKQYKNYPAFYFEISPYCFRYGLGYYWTPPEVLESMRGLILASDRAFLRANRHLKSQNVFEITGEMYKRDRYLDYPQDVKRWLNRKNISIDTESHDFDLLFSDRLSNVLAEGFLSLKPEYEFLSKAAAQSSDSGK